MPVETTTIAICSRCGIRETSVYMGIENTTALPEEWGVLEFCDRDLVPHFNVDVCPACIASFRLWARGMATDCAKNETDIRKGQTLRRSIAQHTGKAGKARATPKTEDNLLRIKQVLELIPVSRSAWWMGVKEGHYPKPYKMGTRSVGWKQSEIEALIEKLGGPDNPFGQPGKK